MENLLFNSDEFGSIRAVEIDGEPWFVGKDVATALGYAETANMRKLLEKDEYREINPQTLDIKGFVQNATTFRMLLVNESGIYNAVFNSTLESAKRFKKWITSEVIPSIRKHGAYATPATIEKLISNPDFGIKLLEALKSEQAKNERLTVENEEMKPKALFADAVNASDTSILIGELAKLIAQNGIPIGQNRMFDWMRRNGYLMKNNMPMQRYIEQGLFEVKERTINNPDGSVRITQTTKVTGRGQIFFINKFLKAQVMGNE